MSETRFTKGPWVVGNRHTASGVYSGEGRLVAATHAHQNNLEWEATGRENDSNAYLIAAAPELYEALMAVKIDMFNVSAGFDVDAGPTLDLIDAALAKARGEA